jgi:dATP/dGTP diphosphohydrolase, N-terminal
MDEPVIFTAQGPVPFSMAPQLIRETIKETEKKRLDEARRRYETRDSGERLDYPSGMRRDVNEGKPRFDLIMPKGIPYEEQMLTRWAALMQRGAVKYGIRNWEKADSEEELLRFRESAFRHLMQWLHEVDDGEDHASAVMFNITAAEFVRYNRKEKGEDQWLATHPQQRRDRQPFTSHPPQ